MGWEVKQMWKIKLNMVCEHPVWKQENICSEAAKDQKL